MGKYITILSTIFNFKCSHSYIALYVLIGCFPGLQSFIVRKSASLQKKVISLRMDNDCAVPVKDFPVKESQYSKHLRTPTSFVCLWIFLKFPVTGSQLVKSASSNTNY